MKRYFRRIGILEVLRRWACAVCSEVGQDGWSMEILPGHHAARICERCYSAINATKGGE